MEDGAVDLAPCFLETAALGILMSQSSFLQEKTDYHSGKVLHVLALKVNQEISLGEVV
jgi:hypothetical protein